MAVTDTLDWPQKRLRAFLAQFPAPTVVAVGVLTVVALGLRLHGLAGRGVPTDEAITLWFVTRWSASQVLVEMPQTQPHYPTYYLLLKGWMALSGSTAPAVARLPSVLAGTLTVVVTYALGKEVAAERAGLVAALFVAVSPFFIQLSQLIRMYAVFVLVTGGSWWCLLRVLRTRSRRAYWGYAAVTFAMVFMHYFGLLFLLAQGVYLVWRTGVELPPRLAGIMGTLGVPAALWVAYRIVWAASSSNRANVIGIPHRHIRDWVRIGLQPWLGQHLAMELTNQQWRFLLPTLVVVGVLTVVAFWRMRGRDIREAYIPLGVWGSVPTGLLLIYSLLRTPILRPRYLAAATLGGFVALGVLVDSVPDRSRIVTVLLLVAAAVAGLPAGYQDSGQMGWVGALDYVDDHAADEDTIVVSSQLPKAADYHVTKTDLDAQIVVDQPPRAVEWSTTGTDIWLVWRHPPPEAWEETERELGKAAATGGYAVTDRYVANKVVVYQLTSTDDQRLQRVEADRHQVRVDQR